jgi:hypothetical protein
VRTVAESFPNARDLNTKESTPLPIPAPGIPARHYFLFGQPLDTSQLSPTDTEGAAALYASVQSAVQGGIDYLLRARELDPCAALGPRLVKEAVSGEQAPTFPLSAVPYKQLLHTPQQPQQEQEQE